MAQFHDPIRKKKIVLSPEERVRQGILEFLLKEMKIPAHLIVSEYALRAHGAKNGMRVDIAVFEPHATLSLRPWLLIECKAPHIVLDEKTARQMERYLQYLPAEYLWMSNGHSQIYLQRKDQGYTQVAGLAAYPLSREL